MGLRSLFCRASALAGVTGLSARLASATARVPVLMYHSVADGRGEGALRSCLSLVGMQVPVATFERQMAQLSREREVISLTDYLTRRDSGRMGGRPAAIVTFDDGFADNLANAVPVLERHGCSATFFLIGGCLARTDTPAIYRLYALLDALDHASLTVSAGTARPGRFALSSDGAKLEAIRALRPVAMGGTAAERVVLLDQLTDIAVRLGRSPVPAETLFIDSAGARALVARGFSLGAHSMTHARLTDLDPNGQLEEIRESGSRVRELQGDGPLAFAYPFGSAGSYSASTGRLLREAGFACAVTTRSGLCGPGTDPFELRRLEIGGFDDAEFRAAVSGLLSFPKAACTVDTRADGLNPSTEEL